MSAGIPRTIHLRLWPGYLEPSQVGLETSPKHCPSSSLSCSKSKFTTLYHCPLCPLHGILFPHLSLEQDQNDANSDHGFRPGAEEGVRFFFTPSLTRLAR